MHLNTYAGEGDEGLVFVGPKSAQLRRANFTRTWSKAVTAANLSGFHFHDLCHTGNTFASQPRATLRELMNRMGHSTTRAALIYQHTVMERDRAIADALGKLAEEALSKARSGRIGHVTGTEDRNYPENNQGPGQESVPDLGLRVWSG
ncbi:tyrosine-type recombinase/integrase [Microbispora rosea]|uniref:tyrosine-type recombinase/integrase n=1 Tax=Microbispora rosea TaxID=58117 RepID=UPI00343C431E